MANFKLSNQMLKVNWYTWHERWTNQKIWVPNRNQTHDLLNTSISVLVLARSWYMYWPRLDQILAQWENCKFKCNLYLDIWLSARCSSVRLIRWQISVGTLWRWLWSTLRNCKDTSLDTVKNNTTKIIISVHKLILWKGRKRH